MLFAKRGVISPSAIHTRSAQRKEEQTRRKQIYSLFKDGKVKLHMMGAYMHEKKVAKSGEY